MKHLQHYLLLSMAMIAYPGVNAHAQNTHSFKLGFEGGYYDYRESGLMENVGGLYGGFGEYKLHIGEMSSFLPDTFMLESNIKGGSADYSSNGTGSLDGVGHFLGEGRVLMGKQFQASNSIKLIPFLGFGYRYLNTENTGKLTTTGHRGYERESNYLYIPIGLKMNTEFNQDWGLDVAAEYDVFVDGEQKSHFNAVRSDYPDAVNQQSKGYGVRASIDLTKKTDSVGFLVGTYIRWWDIGKSNVEQNGIFRGGYEPKNQTLEAGIRAGITF
ncbi:MAG: hypothetical protein HOP02_06835 [Methylococcaceae bacterium]|nr:hypothetical protein [Methylococcaceae bacterium]